MRSYSETVVFRPEHIELMHRAARMVAAIPDALNSALRCHELARAVGQILKLTVQDGHYGAVEHSWLWVRDDRAIYAILDVYCVGRLPQVQLISLNAVLPNMSSYRAEAERTDIVNGTVQSLIELMTDVQ